MQPFFSVHTFAKRQYQRDVESARGVNLLDLCRCRKAAWLPITSYADTRDDYVEMCTITAKTEYVH